MLAVGCEPKGAVGAIPPPPRANATLPLYLVLHLMNVVILVKVVDLS